MAYCVTFFLTTLIYTVLCNWNWSGGRGNEKWIHVFTVATGKNRGIRFPQEGNVFLTWENEWKQVKTSEKLLVWFPQNSPEFPWISPEFLEIPPRLHWPGKASVFLLPVSWNPAQTFWWPACSSGFHQLLMGFFMARYDNIYFSEIGGKFGENCEFWVNFGENWWISGELGGYSVEIGGKLVNCVSPMVKQNSQTVKSISPTAGKKGENEGKLFRNRWGKWKGISFSRPVSIAQYCIRIPRFF